MRTFIAITLIALIFVAIILTVSTFGSTYDPTAYARTEAQIAAIERNAQIAAVFSWAWAALLFVAGVTGLAFAVAWGSAALARFRQLARPDTAGRLPVLVDDLRLVAPAALAAYHATEQQRASIAPVPYSVNYNAGTQHYRTDGGGAVGIVADEPAQLVAAHTAPPTFSDLLNRGRIGKGNPLLLGFERDTGAELPGAWLDLYATATAGLPGTGKTTSQRFFAAQTALHGARFVVCDPHAGAAEDSLAATLDPLRSLYLCDPADDPKRILEAVKFVAAIGNARVQGKDTDTTPIILWVDELTGLIGRSDVGSELGPLLELIAQEYRKNVSTSQHLGKSGRQRVPVRSYATRLHRCCVTE
jgi:hypothetical protein